MNDEGANVYDAAMKVIGELKAEIAKKNEEIATLREALAKKPLCPPIIDVEQRNIGKYPPIPDDFVEAKP